MVAVLSPAHSARGPAPGRGSGPSANAACGFEGPRSGGGAGTMGLGKHLRAGPPATLTRGCGGRQA